ncbi:PucR family transcriptional regulator [Alicyclobacillus mengziensis]|uniref:Helix-turn-helix domain-containing protein n=1 Tax=Alicyclobacillus mengziensis TaxID=2931921 RepID=A0A9X7Z8D9_9BACL|nr:helix-turn-helix domain-containing protein [Alicyclobacillus mengziensis]QSO48183.1 helix-turn-helix domain-containing protein [Alicyclobacillus mengziensis]
MKTAGMWWADTLESFAEAFAIRYDLVQERHPAVRDTGEWWVQGEVWCVQLDSWAHACWLDAVDNPAWRRVLTISLQNASAASTRQLSWRQVVTRHFSELVHHALTDNWPQEPDTHKLGLRLITRELTPPGCFAWLEFSSQSADAQEFRALVEQVIDAWIDVVFVGWTDHPTGLQAAVLFLQTGHQDGVDDEDFDEEDGYDPEGSEGLAAQVPLRPSPLRRTLHPLLDSLESDAMVPVKATVGAAVADVHDWANGLHTLAEAWRERTWFGPGQLIYEWGQQPIAYLLSGLSNGQMNPFLHMAARGTTGSMMLSPDLADTLQGVLAANLNISEASRLLYLHRNTLMNRIDRIRSQTGYDIRQFNDALVLWVAQVLLRRQGDSLPSSSG